MMILPKTNLSMMMLLPRIGGLEEVLEPRMDASDHRRGFGQAQARVFLVLSMHHGLPEESLGLV